MKYLLIFLILLSFGCESSVSISPMDTMNLLDPLFDQFSDSVNTNADLGNKAAINHNLDSAYYYINRAKAFWEAEHIVLLKMNASYGKPE